MVVHHVQHDGQPRGVGRIHQALQVPRPAIRILHGIRKHAVVSPIAISGELRHRHQFDGSDAEILEIRQAGNDRLECARRCERSCVHLVDDVLV